jgi:hypothetical protein
MSNTLWAHVYDFVAKFGIAEAKQCVNSGDTILN